MATPTEMTVTVRAIDNATTVLRGIHTGLIRFGRVSADALKLAGTAVDGFRRRLLSLRSFLGGAFLATITGVSGRIVTDLAKAADSFKPLFDEEQQRRIDQVASSINKFKASLLSTFGNVVSANATSITEVLDRMSAWLRDNQTEIIEFLRGVASALRDIVDFIRVIASGRLKIADLFFGEGADAFHAAVSALREDDIVRAAEKAYGKALEAVGKETSASFRRDLITIMNDISAQVPFLKDVDFGPQIIKLLAVQQSAFGKPDSGGVSTLNELQSTGNALDRDELMSYVKQLTVETNKSADALLNQSKGIVQLATSTPAAAQGVSTLKDRMDDLVQVVEELDPRIDAIAAIMAGGITDAFFEVIEGTKSVAQAFTDMVSSILKDIGRLLVQDALFSVFRGFVGGLFGGGGGSAEIGNPRNVSGFGFVGSNLTGGRQSIVVNQSFAGGGSPEQIRHQTRLGVMDALNTSQAVRNSVRRVAR